MMQYSTSLAAAAGKLLHDLIVIVGCVVLFMVLTGVTDSSVSAFLFLLVFSTCAFLLFLNSHRYAAKRLLLMLAITGLILAIMEFMALVYYKTYILNAPDKPKYNYNQPSYWAEDTELGYRPLSSRHVKARRQAGGKVIYDVEYVFDDEGLRQTRKKAAGRCTYLFFGGSEVFGEGLADLETIPYRFSGKLNYNFNVLNLGFHGYGPHHMLRMLELDLHHVRDIKNSVTVIFYMMSAYDILKISGLYEPYRRGPKYVLISDDPRYAGQLTGMGGIVNSWFDFRMSILNIMNNSRLFSLIPDLTNSKDTIIERNKDLFTRIILESRKIARLNYNAELVVIGRANESSNTNALFRMLSDMNIPTVDLSTLLSRGWDEHYQIPGDANLNDQATDEVATALANRFGGC